MVVFNHLRPGVKRALKKKAMLSRCTLASHALEEAYVCPTLSSWEVSCDRELASGLGTVRLSRQGGGLFS